MVSRGRQGHEVLTSAQVRASSRCNWASEPRFPAGSYTPVVSAFSGGRGRRSALPARPRRCPGRSSVGSASPRSLRARARGAAGPQAGEPEAPGRRSPPRPEVGQGDPDVGERRTLPSRTVPPRRCSSSSSTAGRRPAYPDGLRPHLGAPLEAGPGLDRRCGPRNRSRPCTDRRPSVQKSAFSSRGRPTEASALRSCPRRIARRARRGQSGVREEDREHLGEQTVLVLDRLGPRRDGVGQRESQRGRDHEGAFSRHSGGTGRAVARLADVVQKEVDARAGQLARPLPRRRIERDLDALEAVALQIARSSAAIPRRDRRWPCSAGRRRPASWRAL